jgi:RNA polymerase sigma factor (sigma-70 family)
MPKHQAPPTNPSMLGRLRIVPVDQQAWVSFVDRYGPSIHSWCCEWGLDFEDAAEVTQRVLNILVVRLREFEYDPHKSFRKWLWTVVRHAWADFVRSRERGGRASGSEHVQDALNRLAARDDLLARLAVAFDLELLDEAVARVRARVHARTWDAYHLISVEGQKGREVAAALGMSVANVFVAKGTVMRMLREEVKRLESTLDQ